MSSETPLFAPNNHSKWQIEYKPVDPERAQDLATVLQKNYPSYLDTITLIEQVDEAEINSNNFKIKVQKEGEDVFYLLRRVPASRPHEEIVRTCEIMRLLDKCHVSVPRTLPSTKGDVVVEGDDEWFLLFGFIPGDHYRGTWEELVDAGVKIGALDRELLALTPRYEHDTSFRFSDAYIKVREFSIPIWEDIFNKATSHAQIEGEDSFGAELLTHREEIMTALAELKKAPTVTSQLVHFDLHPHNVLADGTKLLTILDFDSVRYVEKMRAVAFALHRMVRQYVVFTAPANVPEEVDKAKNAFLDAYRTQNSLTIEEVRMIPYFIKHESLSRLTTAMKEYANTGNLVWKHDLSKQLSNIKEADFFA